MENLRNTDLPTSLRHLFTHVQSFVLDTLCQDDVGDDLYVGGTKRIYFRPRNPEHVYIEEHESPDPKRHHDYEEALYERLLTEREFNLLVYFGGLGSGKTTTVNYIRRRFQDRSEALREDFPCVISKCHREPIYLEFRYISRDRKKPVTEIFRSLRLAIFERLILEWLEKCGNSTRLIKEVDPQFMVLRRLLIANDLTLFAGNRDRSLSQLNFGDLVLDSPLTTSCFSDSELVDLIKKYRRAAADYEPIIRRVSDNDDDSQSFIVLALNYYKSKCNERSPLNLIILDNLDELPTRTIEKVVGRLHHIAKRTQYLPILVPLRPSSINPYGFVGNPKFRHHYGPNNFEMIKSRLERFVLKKSRKELAVPRKIHSHAPFGEVPSDVEIDVLLIIAYVYVLIMEAGLNGISVSKPKIIKHEDHDFLDRIRIGPGSRRGLAETNDALVGVCCRYGLDLLRRFFENCYASPTILLGAKAHRATIADGGSTNFAYSTMISCLLNDPDDMPQEHRVSNLFEPNPRGNHAGWPTLTKLRILTALSRDKRKNVEEIVTQLELFGIPRDVAILAINSLQNKYRLLLWLSTNQELDANDPDSLSHDVIISEHGERYFKGIVGDFEYIWYCATKLQNIGYSTDDLKLTVKIESYRRLIHQIGTTEWKQLSFYRLRSDCIPDTSGTGQASPMEVLSVLYSSLGRALLGASIALRVHRERKSLVEILKPHVEQVCELIVFWQNRYKMVFGSNFYLSVYDEEITALRYEMLELVLKGTVGLDEIISSFNRIQESWEEEEKSVVNPALVPYFHEGNESLESVRSRCEAGVIPWAMEIIQKLPPDETVCVYVPRYIFHREQFELVLASGLPTYSELVQHAGYLASYISSIIERLREIEHAEPSLLKWFVSENDVIHSFADTLGVNRYEVSSGCSKEEMTKLKLRHNNIIDATEKLALHFGVLNTSHLSERWY